MPKAPVDYNSRLLEPLVDLAHLAERMFEKEAAARNLSLAQGRILAAAQQAPQLTPSQIARLLHQETHSISGLLNRLEGLGLIVRSRDRRDRRVVHVSLAPGADARVALELSVQAIERIDAELEVLLGHDAQARFRRSLDALEG